MLLAEPLDGAEKRRSKGPGPSVLGVGPGHPRPRLGHPFPRRFSDVRRRAARRIRCRSTFPGPSEYSERDKVVLRTGSRRHAAIEEAAELRRPLQIALLEPFNLEARVLD
jgi:hypothetical protein